MSTEHLHHLARVADELGVAHVIPADVADLIGRPEDFRAAARVWREAAEAVERSSGDVDGKLGGIDTAWQGADAEAFVAHIREAGLAGKDLVDAMSGLAEALEHTAEGVDAQLRHLTELTAETSDAVRAAMLAADQDRAREHLADLAEPARELLDSVADHYLAFTRLCDDMAGGATREPGRWESRGVDRVSAEPPAAETAEVAGTAEAAGTVAAGAPGESESDQSSAAVGGVAAGAAVGAAGVGMGMMPMGMMGGMLGQRGGKERQNASRFKSDPEELFGAPPEGTPAVLGEQPRAQEPQKPQDSQKPQKPQEPQKPEGGLDLPSTLEPAPSKPSIDEVLAPKPKPEPETGNAGVGDAPPPKARG